jgi:hypothetical protein
MPHHQHELRLVDEQVHAPGMAHQAAGAVSAYEGALRAGASSSGPSVMAAQ